MSTQTYTIEPGSVVTLHLSITLEDGTIAESTFDDEPMRFTIGDGTLIKGLELAILGLKAGDEQTLQIGPEVGFGFRDDEAIRLMPRTDFPKELDLQPGLIMSFTTPQGDEVPGAIVDLIGDQVKVDLNHPLAGHEIVFSVNILDVQPGSVAE